MTADSGAPWPEVEFEARPWHRSGDELGSRRELRRIQREYQAAVPALIARQSVSLDPEVLAAADEASHALARFDAETGAITAPFASVLLRTESASSSEVENLTASAKQVALAELGAARSENARLVVANARAMNAALQLSDSLDEHTIIAMHDALLRESAPGFVGRWRDQQVWIGGGRLSPHTAAFIPPHHDRVPGLMADLVGFAERTDVPVLAQAAIAHAQFETIHPFPDGNGRTGRALIHSLLRRGGITRSVTVPVSAGLLHNPQAYFDALTAYRDGDVEAIVHSLAYASFSAIQNGRSLVNEIRAARDRWERVVVARSDAAVHRAKSLLMSTPIITTGSLAKQLDVSDVAASNAINRLVDAGVLTKASGSARYRIWQATEIIDALDGFASRARRGR